MSFAVREALPADAAGLVAIETLASASPWSPHRMRRLCEALSESAERALVAQLSEADATPAVLCGFLVYGRALDEASIHNLATHPDYRRRGVASELLRAAMARWRQSGITRLLLEVRAGNEPARSLYESFGFAVDGVRRAYYPLPEGREDALLMSRCL